MIKITDIHYIAALLEGEGCFQFTRSGSPEIKLKMTDEDTVADARGIMSLKAKIRIGNPTNPKHKTNYTFYIHGSLAIQWMMTIYSIMKRRRKEEIREIIAKWKLIERRQKGSDCCAAGHPLLIEGIDYLLILDKAKSSYTKVCKECKRIYNKEYKENYDRPSRAFNMVKAISKLHNISIEEAEKFLASLSKGNTVQ